MLACVRHGQTSWNERRLLQGSRDIGLDDRGVAQAVAAGRILGATDWAWIRASPLERARRTAGIIAQHVGQLDVHIDAALIERDYGAVEGMPASRAAELFPD